MNALDFEFYEIKHLLGFPFSKLEDNPYINNAKVFCQFYGRSDLDEIGQGIFEGFSSMQGKESLRRNFCD